MQISNEHNRRIRLLSVLALLSSFGAHAEDFVPPASGTLYISCVGGSAGATSQFGTGTSTANFVAYLNSLPGSCPTTEVSVGSVTAGQTAHFGIHTLWGGQDYWAFSDGTDEASVVAFGGNNIQQTGQNTWVMHLNDAAHYTVSTNEANNILIQLRLAASGPAPPQIGGGTCTTAMVNGTYFYLLDGAIASGQSVAYAELGKLVADGQGNYYGNSFGSGNGKQLSGPLSGTYTVQPNCTGSITTTSGPETFQVVNNGQGMVLAISTSNAFATGVAYRQTAGAKAIQCENGSLSGSYGYLLTGVAPGGIPYADAGQLVVDGNGNGTVASVANVGGAVSQVTGNGTYTVASDCSGTASISNQNGTINYRFDIVKDGQVALFFGTDPGWTVAGVFTPQFAPPQQSVVNGASFRSEMVSPGSLFSIFGTGFSSKPATAGIVPLPNSLGETQVLVNGTPAPLLYVGDNQVNAQMPIDVAPGQAVTFTVTNGSTPSNSVTLTLPAAAPGFFTSDGKEAIVQNPNGSMNSSADPAHPGDVLVAYLTGGGAVNASGPWITGADSPGGASSVRAPYSLTVGGHAADVQYVGLAPGFVGLYQTNFKLPTLTAGSYPMVLTVGGVTSNTASVVVGD
jgi:uncharacterized protein (TIGR03437 family)